MKANRASTFAMPSPTFTYATTYTVPRSSPMLSSSVTPFYPRSQQQIYHSQLDASGNHDAGSYASPQEFNDGQKSHIYQWPHAREFYNQECYTSSGSADPYELCWVPNSGNMWGGGAWQSGNPMSEDYVYADDAADDPTCLHSASLSYYAEPQGMEQDFYGCTIINTASVPTAHPDLGATSFNVPQIGAQSEQTSYVSKVKENLTLSLRSALNQDLAVPHSALGNQCPAKSMSNGLANPFYSCKLDIKPFSNQVSSQTSSSFGIPSLSVEPKMKRATTDKIENRHARTDSSEPFRESYCSFSDDHGLLEAIESKHSIQATSNFTSTFESIKGSSLEAQTTSISAEANQKEANDRTRLSPQSSSYQPQSTSGQCPSMMLPKHANAQSCHSSIIESAPLEQRNVGLLLNSPSLVTEMEGKPCVEAIDHEGKMDSSHILPGDACVDLNGSQLLVKCIYNLSKVLESSQSGAFLKILDSTDCLAVENTIYILSERLYQSSINEASLCQDQNCHQLQVAEQESNISDNKEAGRETFLQKSSFLPEGEKHEVKTVSPSTVLENEVLNGLSKVTSSTWVEHKRAEQCSFVKKEFKKPLGDLLLLQCNFTKLQEEVAYERAESNATVTIYKKLWSEAEEALKVSRVEIKELKAELASLKQDFTNLTLSGTDLECTKYDMKTSCIDSGGLQENLLDVKTGSSRHFTTQNLYSEASSKKPFPACSEVVMTNYFAPESISSSRQNLSSWAKGEGTTLRQKNQSGERLDISAIEPSTKHVGGTDIQDEVKQRLSLLLTRPCPAVDKTDASRNVEFSSSFSTSLMERLSLLRARKDIDLNKTDADMDVEVASGVSPSLEASPSNLSKEGEALPPDKQGNQFIWSEKSYMVNASKKIGNVKDDLSCQKKPAFDANYGNYSLVQTQSSTRNTEGMDDEDVNENTFQDDEVEIICLKPGVIESSFTSVKEEAEWEHVVVNGLDDHKTTR